MITYAKATGKDVAALSELSARCFEREKWTEESFLGSVQRGSAVIVAKENKTIIGFVVMDVVCAQGYIQLIAVDDAYRRRGIATRLIDKCFEKNCDEILLDVRESNGAAIAFYESIGFRRIALRKNMYSQPDENGVTMRI